MKKGKFYAHKGEDNSWFVCQRGVDNNVAQAFEHPAFGGPEKTAKALAAGMNSVPALVRVMNEQLGIGSALSAQFVTGPGVRPRRASAVRREAKKAWPPEGPVSVSFMDVGAKRMTWEERFDSLDVALVIRAIRNKGAVRSHAFEVFLEEDGTGRVMAGMVRPAGKLSWRMADGVVDLAAEAAKVVATAERLYVAQIRSMGKHVDIVRDLRADYHVRDLVAKLNDAAIDAKSVIGRSHSEGVGDGYAIYVVVGEPKRGHVRLGHIPVGDAWQAQWIEDLGRVVPFKGLRPGRHTRDRLFGDSSKGKAMSADEFEAYCKELEA